MSKIYFTLIMCFAVLSVHARAEQSIVADASNDNSAEVSNLETTANTTTESGRETTPHSSLLTPDSRYTDTPRDGELGLSLAEMAPKATESAKDSKVDWLADVASRIQLHGYAQGWYYYQNAVNSNGQRENTNTFLCKRILFWANAQITKRWSFLFMHDFSSVVQEYYTDYRITNNNLLTVRFGQFKNALSYENPLSPTAMETIDVYSEGVTYLTGCGSDPLNGVQYGRDQGISLYGETNNKFFRYELQVMNGQGINKKDANNQKDVILRLEVRPAKGLNICATGQLGTGNALVGLGTANLPNGVIFNPTLKAGENYTRNRWTFGADYKSTPFNVHGEYLWGQDGCVHSNGAYVTGSIAIVPKKWDIVLSYDYFNFNTCQNNEMHKVVAGFQYWFFRKCRFQMQYVYKSAATDYKTYFEKAPVHMLMCQMQIRFN